jgi:hypothetical protein
MAERDQISRPLGGHDARHLRGRESIPFGKLAKNLRRLGVHANERASGGAAALVGLGAHVDHLHSARLVHVREAAVSRHFRRRV